MSRDRLGSTSAANEARVRALVPEEPKEPLKSHRDGIEELAKAIAASPPVVRSLRFSRGGPIFGPQPHDDPHEIRVWESPEPIRRSPMPAMPKGKDYTCEGVVVWRNHSDSSLTVYPKATHWTNTSGTLKVCRSGLAQPIAEFAPGHWSRVALKDPSFVDEEPQDA